jgi:hypothetical protein
MTQPIDYTNRLGKTYYLFQGKTKKGNPRYFFSPDPTGGKTECVPLDCIPQGFELFEHPNANVVLRKKIKTAVLPFELHLVRDLVEELERVDQDNTFERFTREIGHLAPSMVEHFQRYQTWHFRTEVEQDSIVVYEVQGQQAVAVLRFELMNIDSRDFSVSRWVFSGMGRWRSLMKTGQIEEVAQKYCPDLATDRFYEMF